MRRGWKGYTFDTLNELTDEDLIGGLTIGKEKLRKRALSFVSIPADFKPIIEEYAQGENGEGEAMFSWANEEKDKGLTINLDFGRKFNKVIN